ncbi:MAG: outer membrane beta-barrel protein [Bacteroidales bacterium]|nr:outer membrane beta-barrel protein [Bacteroidales bacterium]
MSFMMYGQDFPDRIYTNDGETIECCITLVNEQHVYYYHLKRNIRRPDYLPITDIRDYTWTGKCKPGSKDSKPLKDDAPDTKKWGIGVKLVQQFNMPIFHSIMALNVRKGNSNVYVGPHYTHISKEQVSDEGDLSYSQNTYGLNFGYLYTINTRNEIFGVFVQLDFSLYQAESWYYSGLYTDITSDTELVVENCLSVGLKYNISEKFETFAGYGIGSTNGFFFMFDEIIPQVYFGVQFNIR